MPYDSTQLLTTAPSDRSPLNSILRFSISTMADASEPLAQDTANLHLDEVTGERVSKSELKKRQKQRQQEEKKKEKAAAAPAKPEKKTTSAEMDESNLNPNVCRFPSVTLSQTSH